MRILGIDPGLRATGYAVVEGTPQGGVGLLAHGVIRTEEDTPLETRLRQIHSVLGLLIEQIHPLGVAVEDLYSAQRFPRTAILMGHVRGVVCLAAAQQSVEVEALPPAAVKQAITGFGGASKAQIQHAVQRLLRRHERLDSHESDAAAMALTALSRRGVPLLAGAREAVR
ncbi:MAG TPA: crossover junction endodeoxyribonuclease RuvC [bacterium]|nr:crossover junction endodeoxyribonuclease RuvC [bacterium]